MKELILDTLLDTVKVLPFLFITFLIMEIIEHKLSDKGKEKISKSGKFGPFFGSILGAFPQCGFSVMATNLYATRIVTIGTLIAIYLSTSDEMLPILISNGMPAGMILKIILTKVIVGMISGFVIDFIIRKLDKNKKDYEIKDFCLENHCHCEKSILKSALKHTTSVLLFILLINYSLNLIIAILGKSSLESILLKNTIFSPFLASLIGLIPNCASSVLLTELFLNGAITMSSLIAGLLSSSGVALALLFKVNKNQKENFKILFIIYLIGSFAGLVLEAIELFI